MLSWIKFRKFSKYKKFFKNPDTIILTIANFGARTYISKKFEKYKIPYFNCGKEGSYTTFVAYMPGITKPAFFAFFPKTKNNRIPSCTLKLFLSNITHCVSWPCHHFKNFFNENIECIPKSHNIYLII